MTETEQPSASYSLGDFLTVVGRRKWVIIEVTVLVASVAVLLSFQQAKVFRASAEVLLNRQDLGAALTGTPVDQALSGDPTRFGDTQAALARVPEVAGRAIVRARVPGRTAAVLLAESKVSPKANADLLVFTVDDADATAAAKLANAYATAFTVYRLELDTDTLHKARLELDSRIAALRNQGDTSSVLYRALIDKEQQLRTMELLQTRNTVVKQAVKGHQIRPTPKRNGLLGAAFGLFLGLAIAMVWDALDKRVRTEKEIEERLGLPLLARLPEPPRRLASDHRLAMLDDPGSIDSEAVRRLSTNIEFANIDRHAQVLLISSSVQREGKSTTISNLAVALARAGRNVVLVDLDLRQPAVAPFFRITQRIGITDVVLGRAGLDQAIVTIPLSIDAASASAAGPGLRATRRRRPRLPGGRRTSVEAAAPPGAPASRGAAPALPATARRATGCPCFRRARYRRHRASFSAPRPSPTCWTRCVASSSSS